MENAAISENKRDFQSYFFNDTVATKPGDKLSRRGHSEVPLEIHLSVFTSFFHQVKTRHARPAEESSWLAASSNNPEKHSHHSVLCIQCHTRDIKSSRLNTSLKTSQLGRHRGKKLGTYSNYNERTTLEIKSKFKIYSQQATTDCGPALDFLILSIKLDAGTALGGKQFTNKCYLIKLQKSGQRYHSAS